MQKSVLIAGNDKFCAGVKAILCQLALDIRMACAGPDLLKKISGKGVDIIIYDRDSYSSERLLKKVAASGKSFIVVSSNKTKSAILKAKAIGASDYITKPYNTREFITRFNADVYGKTRISCIGGGTGLMNILSGLKLLPGSLLTSIVSTSDSGGSSGRLRTSFGILPPGDIRRSLIALSNAPELMNEVMKFRFKKGIGLAGHNFGNLFLAALSQIKGSMSEAVKDLGDILYIQGVVLPVSTRQTTLCAMFENGKVIKGEDKIDLGKGRDPDLHIKKLWHEPESACDPDAFASIMNSDVVIIGPGDLFTSVITNLKIKNIKEAIARTKAIKIYVCNLMTKPGETANYSVEDHVKQILKYLEGDHLDYIIISNTELPPSSIRAYAAKDQMPVRINDPGAIRAITKAAIVMADVSDKEELVRHDSEKMKCLIGSLIKDRIKKEE